MSKRLENEYKMLINNDVPDLWARIEGGLEPKTGVNAQTVQGQVVPENETVEKQLKNSQRPRTGQFLKNRRGNYRIWGAAAAACICVAVAIPAWLLGNTKNTDGSGVGEAVGMQADVSAAQNASAIDTAVTDTVMAMDFAAADTAAEWEEAAAENAAPAEEQEETLWKESAGAAAAADMAETDKAATTEAVANNGTADREATVADLQSQSRSEYEITVTVTICSIEESPEQLIYTARVEQAADETLVGTQIEIFGSMDTDERLKPDVEYQLELTCVVQEDGKTVFYQKTP